MSRPGLTVQATQAFANHSSPVQAIYSKPFKQYRNSTSLISTGATVFRFRNVETAIFTAIHSNTVGRHISATIWPLKLILEPKFASGLDLSTFTETVSLNFIIGLLTIITNHTTISALKPTAKRI